MRQRVVIRGYGSIGQRHTRVFAELGQDVAVWPARARDLDGLSTCDSYTGADLAVIATDSDRHVSDALEALETGANRVLIEKPVSLHAASLAPLLPHAERVHVAAPLRALNAFPAVIDAVGALGPIRSGRVVCRSSLKNWRPNYAESYSARAGGGALRDLVHEVDYLIRLFGVPVEVLADLGERAEGVVEESAAELLWRVRGGGLLSVRLDFASPVIRRSLRVDDGRTELQWNVLTGTVNLGGDRGRTWGRGQETPDQMYVRQARALLDGSPVPAVAAPSSLGDAERVMGVCDAARLSHETRRWETPDV